MIRTLTCQMFFRFTRRVISLMSTGARRLERSFLCTHRKLISTILISCERTTTPACAYRKFSLYDLDLQRLRNTKASTPSAREQRYSLLLNRQAALLTELQGSAKSTLSASMLMSDRDCVHFRACTGAHLAIHNQVHGDCADEGHELFICARTHAHQPINGESWRRQRPAQEVLGVRKPESAG